MGRHAHLSRRGAARRIFEPAVGPTHRYMVSSPACWDRYGQILGREYSDARLLATHRLTVDTYAVQHPGGTSRQAIQSVGLHLARLMFQLEHPLSPNETNNVMLGLGPHKASLPHLQAPHTYPLTVCDIPLGAPPEHHGAAVRRWAEAAWTAWSPHHDFIRGWAKSALEGPSIKRR